MSKINENRPFLSVSGFPSLLLTRRAEEPRRLPEPGFELPASTVVLTGPRTFPTTPGNQVVGSGTLKHFSVLFSMHGYPTSSGGDRLQSKHSYFNFFLQWVSISSQRYQFTCGVITPKPYYINLSYQQKKNSFMENFT